MTYDAFELLLNENQTSLWLALLLSILLFWWSFFYAKHLFDPLLTQIIFAILANTVPVFLFLMDEISDYFFYFFLRCEILFWIFFGVSKFIEHFFPSAPDADVGGGLVEQTAIDELNRKTFYALFFSYVGIQLFAYCMVGIPVFHEGGRLATFTDSGGGWGILERLNIVNHVVCLMFALYFWERQKERFFTTLCFLCFFLFAILSGGKGYMLIFLCCIFFYYVVYRRKKIVLNKWMIAGSILLVCGCILTFGLQIGNSSLNELLGMLGNRITCFGDCYFLAFPRNTIVQIEVPGMFVFQEPLAAFRLIPRDDLIPAIGFQLNWLVHPWKYGESSGPNTRAPLLAYILFQSEFFCAFLGFIVGSIFFSIRKMLYSYTSQNLFRLAIIAFAYWAASIAIADFILFITEVTNLIFYLIVYAPLWIFYELSFRKITMK